ncbi:HNH/ENDO VII family nuclease [Mycobacteroides abscessus]|uniref:HNH/ENDO VII family nuclease n=1 Tax=Mycobacteroides abscessus TaxID=36809 RepID=UPI001F35FDA7|nr:HNH/ENDO VII family nuclease [Mycobacteroides abscessus]
MAKKANDYMAVVDTWHPEAGQFKDVFDEYKRWVGAPNGTEWTGRTSNAAYDTASTDCHSSDNTNDTAEDAGKLVAATIEYEVVDPLVNGQRLIERVLEHKDRGVSIDQQYHVEYHPAEGESDDSIARNREHVADIERQIKEYVAKWEQGCQTLKAQADAAAQKITGCVNPKTALVDGRKILRDAVAQPTPADPTAQPANFYKDWYAKKTDPASIDPGAGTLADKLEHINNPGLTKPVAAPVDPNAPVYGPPSVQKLDPNSPEGKAAIDKMRVILSPGRTPAEVEDIINRAKNFDPNKQLPPPKAPEGNPTPHRQSGGEAFAESWDQAGRAKDDLLGINGGDHAKEAWKGVAKGLWDVVNPDPVHQVERGIDQAKGAIDEVKSGIDNPKAFIGKHGIEIAAGIATAPVGGEGALLGTEGRALTHGLEDAAPGHPPTPHSVEPPNSTTHAPVSDHPAPAGADHSSVTHDADGPRLDMEGNPLKYLNGSRPDYGANQLIDVWSLSREEQIVDIQSGKLALPEPGPDQQWVRLHPNGPIGDDWIIENGHRLIEWREGDSRTGLWDMGHVGGNEYAKLRDQYHDGLITFRDFIDEYRDPENYRVQDPYRNRSHIDEHR